jgi:hypothetical protein
MIQVIGSERLSLDEMDAFGKVSESVAFAGSSRTEISQWAERLLCHQEYWVQKKARSSLL